jgi:hypothetical protein
MILKFMCLYYRRILFFHSYPRFLFTLSMSTAWSVFVHNLTDLLLFHYPNFIFIRLTKQTAEFRKMFFMQFYFSDYPQLHGWIRLWNEVQAFIASDTYITTEVQDDWQSGLTESNKFVSTNYDRVWIYHVIW